MTIQALNNYVVIEPTEADKATPGGIILPDSAKERKAEGVIRSVGKAVKDFEATTGSTVVYTAYAGSTVKINDKDYVIVEQESILAVIGE